MIGTAVPVAVHGDVSGSVRNFGMMRYGNGIEWRGSHGRFLGTRPTQTAPFRTLRFSVQWWHHPVPNELPYHAFLAKTIGEFGGTQELPPLICNSTAQQQYSLLVLRTRGAGIGLNVRHTHFGTGFLEHDLALHLRAGVGAGVGTESGSGSNLVHLKAKIVISSWIKCNRDFKVVVNHGAVYMLWAAAAVCLGTRL